MTNIAICGCGAIGSWLGLFLASPQDQATFTLIDNDRVGEENLATSAYYSYHVGAFKSIVLGEIMYRKNHAVCQCITETLNVVNRVQLLGNCDLILDCFDNAIARNTVHCILDATLHIGVSADRSAAITWDKVWRPITDERAINGNPVCTHQLGARVLRNVAVYAAGVVEDYLATGRQTSVILTERGTAYG